MPPLTAELAGLVAVAIMLIIITLVVDPRIRARRAANRLARLRRHAAQGCGLCRADLIDELIESKATALLLGLGAQRPAGGKQARR